MWAWKTKVSKPILNKQTQVPNIRFKFIGHQAKTKHESWQRKINGDIAMREEYQCRMIPQNPLMKALPHRKKEAPLGGVQALMKI